MCNHGNLFSTLRRPYTSLRFPFVPVDMCNPVHGLLTESPNPGQTDYPPAKDSHFLSMESLAVTDKLLIDLWGLTISADGVYAIGAAVIIVVALLLTRGRRGIL